MITDLKIKEDARIVKKIAYHVAHVAVSIILIVISTVVIEKTTNLMLFDNDSNLILNLMLSMPILFIGTYLSKKFIETISAK